jgi:hypothetical protein
MTFLFGAYRFNPLLQACCCDARKRVAVVERHRYACATHKPRDGSNASLTKRHPVANREAVHWF